MSEARVLVIGNCTLDFAFRLPRFPRPGETVLAAEPSQDVGGKGANQAVAAARSGVSVLFSAVIGSDGHGRTIREGLAREDVSLDYLIETDAPTDLSFIFVSPSGENSIVSTHAAAESMKMQLVQPLLEAAVADDILLMQGNLSHDLTRDCLRDARRRNVVTVLNPAPIQYPYDDIWPFVDCAILNEVETEHLTGCADPIAGTGVLLRQEVRQVLVTLGARGAVLAQNCDIMELAAERVEAVDTTGAGDVLSGVLAAGLARGLGIEPATRRAMLAATLSVTRHGTQSAFPSRSEIRKIFDADIP